MKEREKFKRTRINNASVLHLMSVAKIRSLIVVGVINFKG